MKNGKNDKLKGSHDVDFNDNLKRIGMNFTFANFDGHHLKPSHRQSQNDNLRQSQNDSLRQLKDVKITNKKDKFIILNAMHHNGVRETIKWALDVTTDSARIVFIDFDMDSVETRMLCGIIHYIQSNSRHTKNIKLDKLRYFCSNDILGIVYNEFPQLKFVDLFHTNDYPISEFWLVFDRLSE